MKKILVILMLVFAFGCSDDAKVIAENSIVGRWKKEFKGEIEREWITLILDFANNGKFVSKLYSVGENIDVMEYNYTFSNNILIISSEECTGDDGKYRVEFKNNGFELKLIDDKCDNRNLIFTGFYAKYVGSEEQKS